MSFLAGLHGTAAAIVICTLLFVDEAGVPLPIAPSEGLLLLTGVLVSTGAFPLWVIVPAAYIAMAGGMMTGYLWARSVGQSGLQAVADRVHATDLYERARERMQASGPWGIGICRLIPGLRPHATLISGAAEVDLRVFLLGALPALLVWEVVLMATGILVGLPAALLLGRFEKLLIRGAILLALGAVAWLAIRNASTAPRDSIDRLTPRLRPSLALLVDAALVLSLVAGLFAIARRLMEVTTDGWIELLAAAFVLLVLLVAGRSLQTPGETLFDTHYWHHVPATPR
jgi:membrane protein DedA with SNARE-associated domain